MPLVPPEFDFTSPAYVEWGDRDGQVPHDWLEANVIGPYRSKFPLFGGCSVQCVAVAFDLQ